MLPGVGCELPKELAWWHGSGVHGRHATQNIRPVRGDEAFLDPAADQPLQLLWASRRIEEANSLRWQIPDAGNELESQQGGDGEDMVGEAARVGVLFAGLCLNLCGALS